MESLTPQVAPFGIRTMLRRCRQCSAA
jgi:hypothetical protein